MRRAVVVALLVLWSCTKYEKQDVSTRPLGSASSSSSSSSVADAGVDAAIPVSTWSKGSTDELELVATPDRGAVLGYLADYRFHRGDATSRLPREWFGVGPPRRDLSLSADGNTLAVPVVEPGPDEAAAVILYDTRARRFAGRFAVSKKDAANAKDGLGKVSADGKGVVWTFAGRPCMVTEVPSGKLDVDAAKHAKCK